MEAFILENKLDFYRLVYYICISHLERKTKMSDKEKVKMVFGKDYRIMENKKILLVVKINEHNQILLAACGGSDTSELVDAITEAGYLDGFIPIKKTKGNLSWQQKDGKSKIIIVAIPKELMLTLL